MKNTWSLIPLSFIAITIVASGCASHSCKDDASCCEAPAKPAAITSTPTPTATPQAAPSVVAPTEAAPTKSLKLTVVKVDSEETSGEDGKAANAVDGDPSTVWHTQWQDSAPECPHEITIDLNQTATIKGFTYLPRQDDSENGTIKDYEFYVSTGGNDFQKVAQGSFENSKDKKTVTFAPVKCHTVKLKALSEVNDGAWTSAAEIGVISAE